MSDSIAKQTVVRVVKAVLETVSESQPTPESTIHLALQSMLGLTHAQCAHLLDSMIQAGLLERSNHQLSIGDKKGTAA